MQRYRAAILFVLFGVLPVASAFFIALLFLEETTPEPEPVAEPVPETVQAPPAAPKPEKREVIVAARGLPVGALLGEADLDELALEPDAVRPEHLPAAEITPASLRGYAVRKALTPEEPLTRSAVVGPGQPGFLAAVLEPGMRAVTIEVGPATKHAGLVDPGDRVDVILTGTGTGSNTAALTGPGQEAGEGSFLADLGIGRLTRTILEDVRVVGVNRRTGGLAGPVGGGDGEQSQRTEIVTATLEVSPRQADQLVHGGLEGTLSLAVRSLAAAVPPSASVAVHMDDLLVPVAPPPPDMPTHDDMEELEARMEEKVASSVAESEERLHAEIASSEERIHEAIASSEERVLTAMTPETAPPRVERVVPMVRVVRIFRGSEPAEEITFGGSGPAEEIELDDWPPPQ